MAYVQRGEHKPFVPGFLHDIFISYAHRDNRPAGDAKQGWVSTFADILGQRLGIELGSDFSLWMDDLEVAGNKPLTRQIMQALEGTATFLVIASPGYQQSVWCDKECEAFMQLIRKRTDSDSRVFLVELNEVKREEFPAEFSELTPYYFWTQEGRIKRILGWPALTPSEKSYYDQITHICIDLAEELKRLKKLAQTKIEAPPAGQQPLPVVAAKAQPGMPPIESPVESPLEPLASSTTNVEQTNIYLAGVTGDLNLLREEVVGYLEQLNFRVLPETWQRYEDLADFEGAFTRDISQCELFVQLLSDNVGELPFGLAQGLPRLQYERARAAGKQVLQWRDPKLEMSAEMDADQRALLEGCDVRAVGIEEFKAAVPETITAAREAAAIREAAATKKESAAIAATIAAETGQRHMSEMGKLVYIGADSQDKERVRKLISSNDWVSGVGGLMLEEDDDPGSQRRSWEESLRNCDGALLVYFQSEPSTVISKIKKYCGFLLSQDVPPFSSVAIYDGPPPPDQKVGIDIIEYPRLNLRNLNCRKDHQALADFLKNL